MEKCENRESQKGFLFFLHLFLAFLKTASIMPYKRDRKKFPKISA